MSTVKYRGLYLGAKSVQYDAFRSLLLERSGLLLEYVGPNKGIGMSSSSPIQKKDIVVVDYNCEGDDELLEYKCIVDSPQVIINCPHDASVESLVTWRNLSGVFYESDAIDSLCEGFNRVIGGEFWFSRELSQRFISLYRSSFKVNSHESARLLTEREQEILKFVSKGMSNIEIASLLFVSENTIKTHLHHIFKKIHVKNRVAAMLWLKDNG